MGCCRSGYNTHEDDQQQTDPYAATIPPYSSPIPAPLSIVPRTSINVEVPLLLLHCERTLLVVSMWSPLSLLVSLFLVHRSVSALSASAPPHGYSAGDSGPRASKRNGEDKRVGKQSAHAWETPPVPRSLRRARGPAGLSRGTYSAPKFLFFSVFSHSLFRSVEMKFKFSGRHCAGGTGNLRSASQGTALYTVDADVRGDLGV